MKKIPPLGLCAVLVCLDQLFKYWVVVNINAGERIPIIPRLFYLSYVENTGAAFGILPNHTRLLAVVSVVVMVAALAFVLSVRVKSKLLLWSVCVVVAGGLGNCIDRFARGFVVDYLDFSALFSFPVFNFADCCVVVGTGLILIHILTDHREQLEEAAEPATTQTESVTEEAEGEHTADSEPADGEEDRS